jgi:predicted GIY-YIG superfamily endonuclease
MVKIYCIEDINDLKYVGSTTQRIEKRFTAHKQNKINKYGKCSSMELNLYHSIVYLLEECEESERKEREKYWINKIDCVNRYKLNGLDKDKNKEYLKEWQKNNREKCREATRRWRKNNPEKAKERDKKYNRKRN